MVTEQKSNRCRLGYSMTVSRRLLAQGCDAQEVAPGVPARAKLRRVHEDTQPGEVALMNETVLEPKWSAIL